MSYLKVKRQSPGRYTIKWARLRTLQAKRFRVMNIRVSSLELVEYRRKAKTKGISLSELVRRAVGAYP